MRRCASVLCLLALLLCGPFAAAPAQAASKYRGQCGGISSFRNGTNYRVKYAVVTSRTRNCRAARRVMASYLDRMGRYARAGRCAGSRCANAAPKGWRCALTSYAARHRGNLASCSRKRVSVTAKVWPPVS